jgi:hypothetical protein
MEAGLDRSNRPTEPDGDFGEREVRPVVEDDDDAFIWRQATDEAEGFVTVEQGLERILHGAVVFGRKLDETDPTVSSHPVSTSIYDDPIEPGLECRWVAQRSRRLPSSDCRVVGDVLGIRSVTEDQTGEPVSPVKPTGDLTGETLVGLTLGPQHRPLRRLPESA